MRQRNWTFVISALALGAIAMGCGDGSAPTGASSVASAASSLAVVPAGSSPLVQQGDVRLRVAHLSTDAPPVDIWVNGTVVLSNVPFGTVSDYLALDAGEYRIQVTPAGAQAPIVIDATVPLASGNVYTVAAVGFLSSGSLEPLVLLDDLATSAGARIRFVHASADTGAVDVAVTAGPVLFPDVTFQEASAYADVPAGTYDLEARPAGSSTVALSIPGVSVSSGTTYTVFAIGRSFNGSLSVLPVVDAP